MNFTEEVNSKDFEFLIQTARLLADSAQSTAEIADIALPRLVEYCQAPYAHFAEYDPAQRALCIRKISSDSGIFSAVHILAGKKLESIVAPLDNSAYQHILKTVVGYPGSIHELSFGSLPPKISQAIQTATGLQQFAAISHAHRGELYGATLLAFRKQQTMPALQIMAAYSEIVAAALRNSRAETALKNSEEKYRQLTEHASDIIWTADLNMELSYISPSIKTVLGFSPAEYMALSPFQRHPDKQVAALQAQLTSEIDIAKTDSHPKTYMVDAQHYRADGSLVWLAMHISLLRDENGRPYGLHGISRDNTATRKIEAANRVKSEFLANISHEIRTPLNSILGFTDLLHEQSIDSTARQYAENIKLSALNLLALVNDVINIAGLEGGKTDLDYKPTVVQTLIQECLESVTQQAELKGLTLVSDISNDSPACIICDHLRVKQILVNLLGNAVKYTENGSVTLKLSGHRSEDDQAAIIFSIIDTGIGIPQE
ncbi:MAG: PAS domain S-box protein, partial [Spirochaetaceae bacterium]